MPIIILPDGGTDDIALASGDTIRLSAGDSYTGAIEGLPNEALDNVSVIISGDLTVPPPTDPVDFGPLPGIYISNSFGADNSVRINETGFASVGAITVSGGLSRFVNLGEVVSNGSLSIGPDAVVDVSGIRSVFRNLGDILQGQTYGAGISGRESSGYNAGRIEGGREGVNMFSDFGTFVNTGSILSEQTGFSAFGEAITFRNSGLVDADSQEIIGLSVFEGDERTAVRIDGGASTVYNSGTLIGDVLLFDGTDRYIGAGGSVDGVIDLGDGDDRGFGGDFADEMVGGGGNDVLQGRGGGDDLSGGTGNDRLLGGDGDDRLEGGAGFNWLTGGAGQDTFVFGANSGTTAIRDFEGGVDVVEMGNLFADFDAVLAAASDSAQGVRIALSEDATIILEGLTVSDLSASDFSILSLA